MFDKFFIPKNKFVLRNISGTEIRKKKSCLLFSGTTQETRIKNQVFFPYLFFAFFFSFPSFLPLLASQREAQ